MFALISLLTIITLSVAVVRVGAIALELTGLSREVAEFQAQSAFSGVGFTTSEAETVVSHPVRRRIARILILLGSAGFSSSIATFILTFIGQSGKDVAFRGGFLLGGVLIISLLARSKVIYNAMRQIITWALERYTSLRVCDYQEILGLSRGFQITRFVVHENSWLVGRSLRDLKLHLEGVLVLSVQRQEGGREKFIGVPTADTTIQNGDILICYGRGEALRNLSHRIKGTEGDRQHEKEVRKEKEEEETRKRRGEYS